MITKELPNSKIIIFVIYYYILKYIYIYKHLKSYTTLDYL